MFKFELECGGMENKFVTKSFRIQLNQVSLHEQEDNGVAINNNLNANQKYKQFITPKKVSQSEQRHSWTKKRPTSHKKP